MPTQELSMTFPNDMDSRPEDRRVIREERGFNMWWIAALAAAIVLGIFAYVSSGPTNVARNDAPNTSTTRFVPPAPTTPAPAGTTGISPNPMPTPPAR